MRERKTQVQPWCLRKSFNEEGEKKTGQGINDVGRLVFALIPYKRKREDGLNDLLFSFIVTQFIQMIT
jgi:hypothetical protein